MDGVDRVEQEDQKRMVLYGKRIAEQVQEYIQHDSMNS